MESLCFVPPWIFLSKNDISWIEYSKVSLIVEWRLFMKFFKDWSRSVVPRKIKKISSKNLFEKRIAQMKASEVVSLWRLMKRMGYGGATFVPIAALTS